MGKVVHFEIPADDLDGAKSFYGNVFGWQLFTMEMPGGGDYTSATTTTGMASPQRGRPGVDRGPHGGRPDRHALATSHRVGRREPLLAMGPPSRSAGQ